MSGLRGWSFALLALAGACGETDVRVVHVAVSADAGIELAELVVSPASALARKRLDGAWAALELRGPGPVTLAAPFACPVVVELGGGGPAEVRLMPLFELGPSRRVVGFDRPFELSARPACDAARTATATLAVTGGTAVADLRVLEGGARLTGRTLPPPALAPGVRAGIVPVADAERGATRVELSTRLLDGRTRRRTLEVAATTRASGLANVALEHRVLLRGEGLRLAERPPESRAELRPAGALLELVPDVPGRFVLEGSSPARTIVEGGRYDETPLDCGRAECHRSIAESALRSPMTHAYARDLAGPRALPDPSCALACHTTGEPGVDDGGFTHVARELGAPVVDRFGELPRDLRRLGGVGCLACHGPGAIPEPSSRYALLGRGVCAVCHDSPPTYGHVRAFGSTRMAASDRDPRTSEQPCARCHTTFGALGRPGHRPPAGFELGLGCVTCHDVHPHAAANDSPRTDSGVVTALLRELPLPDTLGTLPASMLGPSRVCLSCHAPSRAALLPEASAAALVLGRGGTEPRAGTPLTGPSPHAAALGGCLSCHRSGPEGSGRGASHAFAAGPESCSSCHAARPRDPSLAARARALFDRSLGPAAVATAPPHAAAAELSGDPARTRAFANVALVLEDPAADVHNPAYAALLLDAAEAVLLPRARRGVTSHAP